MFLNYLDTLILKTMIFIGNIFSSQRSRFLIWFIIRFISTSVNVFNLFTLLRISEKPASVTRFLEPNSVKKNLILIKLNYPTKPSCNCSNDSKFSIAFAKLMIHSSSIEELFKKLITLNSLLNMTC